MLILPSFKKKIDSRTISSGYFIRSKLRTMWYTENGMIMNPDKHHGMVLRTTDHKFPFPVEDSLDLLGMTIENQLNFDEHVS